MPAIMADHDIEGHMQVLLRLLNSPKWRELWSELAIQVESLPRRSVKPIALPTCPAKLYWYASVNAAILVRLYSLPLLQSVSSVRLSNDLIGLIQHLRRDRQTQLVGDFEIDHKFDVVVDFDWNL